MRQNVDQWICPECGAEVAVGACGCPRCREAERRRRDHPAPVRRHWHQDEIYDGLDLPDDEFDYRGFTAREFGRRPHRRRGIAWYWWLTALLLAAAFAAATLGGLW